MNKHYDSDSEEDPPFPVPMGNSSLGNNNTLIPPSSLIPEEPMGIVTVPTVPPSLHLVNSSMVNADGTVNVSLLINPPSAEHRIPLYVVLCVDVSGSMDSAASMGNGNDDSVAHTVLALVKHALLSIIQTAMDADHIGIVTFSDNARTVLPLTPMNIQGKEIATKAVQSLITEGSTNLWAGIDASATMLEEHYRQNRANSSPRHYALLSLTDGQPNISPARGEIGELRRRTLPLPYTLHTFGFGYGLNSALLHELAIEGGGGYSFIPDATMIGTVFINTLSCIRTVYATNANVTFPSIISLMDGRLARIVFHEPAEFPSLVNSRVTTTSQGINVYIGDLTYGPQYGMVLRALPIDGTSSSSSSSLSSNTSVTTSSSSTISTAVQMNTVTFTYNDLTGNVIQTMNLSFPARCENEETSKNYTALFADAEFHRVRTELALTAMDAHKFAQRNNFSGAVEALTAFIDSVRSRKNNSSLRPPSDRRIAELLRDVDGQAMIAVSKPDYFGKWGCHYLPSLARAHATLTCNNFKDPGVQVYAGSLFQQLRDAGDTTFKTIPAPVPIFRSYDHHSRNTFGTGTGGGGGNGNPQDFDMSRYMDPNGGCFDGEAIVQVSKTDNGPYNFCHVKNVRQDDYVLTPEGPAKVLLVLRTTLKSGIELVKLTANNLILTPYHPICLGDINGNVRDDIHFAGTNDSTVTVDKPDTLIPTTNAESIASIVSVQRIRDGSYRRSIQVKNNIPVGPFIFPKDLPVNEATLFKVPDTETFDVYDFVLDKGHIVQINGTPCITIGHGNTQDPVANHPFFGTNLAINALAQLKGFDTGLVSIGPNGGLYRSKADGLICGYAQL